MAYLSFVLVASTKFRHSQLTGGTRTHSGFDPSVRVKGVTLRHWLMRPVLSCLEIVLEGYISSPNLDGVPLQARPSKVIPGIEPSAYHVRADRSPSNL